ncbi:unnamed protein product [Peronospora farinosa]|uniref:CLASP N-terminal domain-containing protein n=1 Tax=Peronospora farinosa TaxID=134698 RepID=A0AAV0UEN7_9STRA|nr:unnamed protein product [Peronospora farinosa]CAI5734588.1 unnamed protein product [Peronospora farinosa]
MERLILQIQETQKVLQKPKTDWSDCCASIEDLATAVESLGQLEDYKDVVRLLLSLSRDIGVQIRAIRSKLVKDVCEHLIRIVMVTGRDFQEMANVLLPSIIATSKSTLAAIRQPGAKLLSRLSEKVRYDLAIVRKIYENAMQEKTCVLVLEQLRIVFVYWSDEEVLPWESDVLEMVRLGLNSQHSDVRKAARDVLCRFSSRWSERVDELRQMLSDQAKALLIQEHRSSPLAAAIMEKHPEIVTKLGALSRNRAILAQSRSRLPKSVQNTEIHVSATPPPHLEQQKVLEQKPCSSGGSAAKTSRTAPAPEGTEISESVRRALDNPGVFGGSDDCQQEETATILSRSQMHVLYAKQEIGLSNASEVEESPCPRADIHSPTTVTRASSASNAEETLLQHSSVQIEDFQISGLSNRSSGLYGEKHQESPTRSSGSPELWVSRPPRQGSFSLKGQESMVPSTHGSNAYVEEDTVEPNPFSASDEYFSKPIPSSLDAPSSPSPSTENVTHRPRRQTLAHQEHNNSPPQLCSSLLSSPKLTAPKGSQQLRLVDTIPESVSKPNQGARSPLREQYADYVHDGEDDIGELTGVGDHEELNIEWDHCRLDDIRLQNEGKQRSVENDDDQEGDVFSDEWHVDEKPRHRRDSLNEVGDLVSGNLVDVADNNETATENEPKMSEMDRHAKLKLQGHCPMRNDTQVEEDREKRLSVEAKLGGHRDDALAGLLNVRKEMTHLRAMTNNEESCGSNFVEKRSTPAQNVLDAADIAEEAQEQFHLKQDTQTWKEPKKAGRYMERLTHADGVSRSSLIVPSNDVACEQPKESSSLKLPEQGMYHATTRMDSNERLESNYLGLQGAHSPPRVSHHSNARIDEPKLLRFAEKDRGERIEAPSLNLQQDARPRFQASFDAHEQAGRFDEAEKLFATKDDPSALGIYNRPQSPEPERYMHSKPYQVRFPPTQLGAKLNPSFAKAQKKIVVEEKIDAASKDVVTEDVTAVANAEIEAAPVEGHKEVSLKDRQPVSSHDETNEIVAPDCAKRDTTPDTAPRLTSKVSAVVQGRKTPPATLGWASSFAITIVVFLAAMFCMIGILRAAKKVQDSHEYHLALKTRIEKFEASITETHKKVLKLEDDYAIWSDYVRKLTEEDEVHALAQLEAIQVEVQKWQHEMNADLVAFQQALLVDSIGASFADLHVNNTKQI